MNNSIRNRLDNLLSKQAKKKIHVVFIENGMYTYHISNAGNEGQTVSKAEYDAYRRIYEGNENYIFFEVSFANNRRIEDFE